MSSLTSDRLRGGVIGFGNIGQTLTRFLRERRADHAQVVAMFDPSPVARGVAERDFGLLASSTLDEFFAAKLDFVIIASISSAHAEHVERAAQAGCHVFCEKPIALTLVGADRAIAAAEGASVVNVVNYSLRYIEAYRTLHAWSRNGRFGQLLSVSHRRTRGFGLHIGGARHPAVLQPGISGGWAVHHACHALDLLYWLNGPFSTVYGRTATTVANSTSEEIVEGLLTYANGGIGQVGDSVCGLREHHTQIIGTLGSAVLSGEHEHTRLRFRGEGAGADETVAVRDTKNAGAAFDHFFECIRIGARSPQSLREARVSLAAALALRESAATGKVLALAS